VRILRLLPWLLAAACATAAPAPAPFRDLLDPVDMVRALNDPDGVEVYSHLASHELLVAVPSLQVAAILEELHHSHGKLKRAKLRSREPSAGGERIVVEADYSGATMGFTLTLDTQGRLAGLLVQPLGPTPGPADDYRAHVAYSLPVVGEWVVRNGGPEAAQNHHVGNLQQWYAYDLVRTDEAHKSCPEPGEGNAGCLAFDQDVVAPADGTVTFAADGIPDNTAPGETDKYFVLGNAIGIDHGGGEFSFLCNLEAGSLKVHAGDHVKRGQLLASVGNSGNSSEPHLHWHLATDLRVGKGHGLPIRFGPLLVGGKLENEPRPVRGDRIAEPSFAADAPPVTAPAGAKAKPR
jgi:hypothetical protein